MVLDSKPPLIVVSDFDGTITEEDLVVRLTTHFAPENKALVDAINAGQVPLGEGLAGLFHALPSSRVDEYRAFIQQHGRIRPGFAEFLDRLGHLNIPFYVASNGVDLILEPILKDLVPSARIYANSADLNASQIVVRWTYPCLPQAQHGCGLCKPRLIKALREQYQAPLLFIGDGVTDFAGAQEADYVLARSRLAERMALLKKPFAGFADFTDVTRYVSQMVEEVLAHDSI